MVVKIRTKGKVRHLDPVEKQTEGIISILRDGLTCLSKKIHAHRASLLLSFSAFFIFFVYNQSKMFGSDSAVYASVVRYLVENRSIPPHMPYWVSNVSNGHISFFPLCYPLLQFLLASIFYASGGEIGLRFYSSMLAGVCTFVIYVFASKFSNKKIGLLTTGLVFICPNIFVTFGSAMLLEQLLLVFVFLTLYFYVIFVKTNKRKYSIYGGIALGLTLATKQSGLLFATSLLLYTILFQLYKISVNKKISADRLKNWLLLFGIAVLVSAPFLLYLILDTGTIDYPPGHYFWFLKPKWTPDPESIEYLSQFWPLEHSGLLEKTAAATKSIFYTLDQGYPMIWEPFRYVILLLFGLGTWYLFKKDKLLLSICGVLVTGDVCFFIVSGAPPRYFVLTYSLVMMAIGLGILELFNLINRGFSTSKMHIVQRVKTPLIVSGIICLFMVAFVSPTYFHYYPMTSTMPEASVNRAYWYKIAAMWVTENTSEDALFLAGRGCEVTYYWRRQSAWVDQLGMSKVPEILYCRDLQKTMCYLRNYGIDYIVYDPFWVYVDYFPPGLSDFFKYGDPHFELAYENVLLRIYKVVYDKNIPIYPSYLDEPGSVELGLQDGGLDTGVFYPNVRVIFAYPRNMWNLNSKGLTPINENNCLSVSLSPNLDKDDDSHVDDPIIITIEGNVSSIKMKEADTWQLLNGSVVDENVTQFQINQAWYVKVAQEAFIPIAEVKIVHSYMELSFPEWSSIRSIKISFSQ